MSDAIFNSQMMHTCTLVVLKKAAATTGSYGHKITPRADGGAGAAVATYPGLPCLFLPLSADEKVQRERAGSIISQWDLYLPGWCVPESLKRLDASLKHEIHSVYLRAGNVLIDEGPFDINDVTWPLGIRHHVELALMKVS